MDGMTGMRTNFFPHIIQNLNEWMWMDRWRREEHRPKRIFFSHETEVFFTSFLCRLIVRIGWTFFPIILNFVDFHQNISDGKKFLRVWEWELFCCLLSPVPSSCGYAGLRYNARDSLKNAAVVRLFDFSYNNIQSLRTKWRRKCVFFGIESGSWIYYKSQMVTPFDNHH